MHKINTILLCRHLGCHSRALVQLSWRVVACRGHSWAGGVTAIQSGGGRGSGAASTGKRGSSGAGHAPPLRPWVNGVRALGSVCLSSHPRRSPVARGGQACGSRRRRSSGAVPWRQSKKQRREREGRKRERGERIGRQPDFDSRLFNFSC